MTDASLALSGYTYTVTVVNADGTRDTYNTLSAAVSAVSSYDSTINGSGSTDSECLPEVHTRPITNQLM